MDLMIALLWVHPLAWLLRSQWREEIEHQADRAVLGQIEADEYASDLLRLVRTGHAPPPPIGVAFAHSSSSNRFRRRLLRLFETPNESKRSGTIACAAAALLFTFTLLTLSWHHSVASLHSDRQDPAMTSCCSAAKRNSKSNEAPRSPFTESPPAPVTNAHPLGLSHPNGLPLTASRPAPHR